MRLIALAFALLWQAQEPPRDPTEADPRMRQALLQGRAAAPAPAVKLRGVVVAKGKPGAAVLELGDRYFRVTENSTLAEGGVQWKVVAVRADEVRLEAQATGQTLVLR
jgi:hypothetical protein